MIEVYPVKVEAVDKETKELIFTIETFDGSGATITFHQHVVGPSNIDNVTAAMRRAIAMLELV